MMTLPDAATALYEEQERIVRAAVIAATDVWRHLDPGALSASWVSDHIGDHLFLTVARAQELAAMAADVYTDLALLEQGIEVDADGRIVPSALAGVASDGRSLDGLLLQPLVTTNVAQAGGATAAQAMAMGLSSLTRIVDTQVSDAGRAATSLGVAARPRTGYVRLVNPGACARCAILAGRWYRWSDGFERHPMCHCRNIPAAEDSKGDVRTDPMALFHSLSEAEQNRQFTKAGAQAIRDGADINRVVDARRGALGLSSPGRLTAEEKKALRNGKTRGRLQRVDVYGRPVHITSEATTVRSAWGRAEVERRGGPAPRLMPESIYQIATDREDAVRLLKRFGYLR
jgi:hypothetical protein